MIKFNYIIGANIELAVEARILPADLLTNTPASADIESVKLNGMDVETDDISISDRTLDSLLKEAAMVRAWEDGEDELCLTY